MHFEKTKLESTPDALERYGQICDKCCEKAEHILQEQDDADREAYANLTDVPHGMGFCFAYWAEKRAALAKRGIEWRSPSVMNPRVLFD